MPRLLVIFVLILAGLASPRAADLLATRTNLPLCFTPALTKWQETARFQMAEPGATATEWQPYLQLLVGVTAVDDGKRTVHLVELTTLPLLRTTNSLGRPALRTNHWTWAATNKAQFITTIYPVRVRVFDAAGQLLKEGRAPMAWGQLTNGLLELCQLRVNRSGSSTNLGSLPPEEGAAIMRATGNGLVWMMGMFQDLQTVPSVKDVWGQAQCAIRWPSTWSLAKSLFTGLDINLVPGFNQITAVPAPASAPLLYRLPVELRNGSRCLCQVEILVGPAQGAEMLLAGVQSIRAQHPTKPTQEFHAQVLASGRITPE